MKATLKSCTVSIKLILKINQEGDELGHARVLKKLQTQVN